MTDRDQVAAANRRRRATLIPDMDYCTPKDYVARCYHARDLYAQALDWKSKEIDPTPESAGDATAPRC